MPALVDIVPQEDVVVNVGAAFFGENRGDVCQVSVEIADDGETGVRGGQLEERGLKEEYFAGQVANRRHFELRYEGTAALDSATVAVEL